jgi:DNA polymerase
MRDEFSSLLDAAIAHIEELKASGARFVEATPESLRSLASPAAAGPSNAVPSRTPGEKPAPAPAARVPDNFSSAFAPAQPTQPARPTHSAPPIASSPTLPAAPAVSPITLPPAISRTREEKEQALAVLREKALACTTCAHLATTRRKVVFGVGDVEAQLMFVGEAPGADEDVQGEPFVGRAGQLLTRIIGAMGLSRQTVYIANILKCRPDMPPGASGNRKPTADEMQACMPHLLAQIDLIRPRVLVALGGTAADGLFGGQNFITRLRGTWKTFAGIPVMPTFHPSFLLRFDSAEEERAKKRQVWEDMLRVMERLEMPISEKQRAFFLKAGA